MEELKRFLKDKGILKEYLQAISDERTCQNPRGSRPLRYALTSYHNWMDTSNHYPNISNAKWHYYSNIWEKRAPEGDIESRTWLIEQLTESKKLRLLNAIKDFR